MHFVTVLSEIRRTLPVMSNAVWFIKVFSGADVSSVNCFLLEITRTCTLCSTHECVCSCVFLDAHMVPWVNAFIFVVFMLSFLVFTRRVQNCIQCIVVGVCLNVVLFGYTIKNKSGM